MHGPVRCQEHKLLTILTHNILPVFSIMVLGFAMGRMRFVSTAEASTLNRIAFLILQPALIFPLVNGVDLGSFYFDAIALYALAQIAVFLTTLLLSIYLFKSAFLEAWLLAMATIFVNSLLYIWPISTLIYGSGGNIPIMAAVVWDATVTFAFFIITTDLLANRGQSAGQSLLRLVKNPVLIAIALGLGSNGLGLIAAEPLLVACKFAGAGAALRRLRVMAPEGDGSLIALAVNVTYPCFILENIVGNKSLHDPANVWLPLVCGAGFMIVGGVLAWLWALMPSPTE